MCVKLPPRDLNLGIYPPHLTSTYTCGVTIAPKVCDGKYPLDLSKYINVLTHLFNDLMYTIHSTSTISYAMLIYMFLGYPH